MSVPATLSFSQLVELLLAQLYTLEQEHGAGRFFNLNGIAASLKEDIPSKWVFDAGRVLESRGLATCIFTMGGPVEAELTGEGRMFVEERRDQGSGIISEYQKCPQNFVVVSGQGHQVVVTSPGARVSQSIQEARKPAFELVEEIREQLQADAALGPQEKEDLLTDVETIRKQLEKREPNRVVLASLLEPLSQIASTAGAVANLIALINV